MSAPNFQDEETKNYFRLILIFVNCVPSVLRKILTSVYFKLTSRSWRENGKNLLKTQLKDNTYESMDNTQREKYDRGNIEEWDYSLLVKIMKNLKNVKYPGKSFHDLSDVRNNVLMHAGTTRVQNYEDPLNKIQNALTNIIDHYEIFLKEKTEFLQKIMDDIKEYSRENFQDSKAILKCMENERKLLVEVNNELLKDVWELTRDMKQDMKLKEESKQRDKLVKSCSIYVCYRYIDQSFDCCTFLNPDLIHNIQLNLYAIKQFVYDLDLVFPDLSVQFSQIKTSFEARMEWKNLMEMVYFGLSTKNIFTGLSLEKLIFGEHPEKLGKEERRLFHPDIVEFFDNIEKKKAEVSDEWILFWDFLSILYNWCSSFVTFPFSSENFNLSKKRIIETLLRKSSNKT